MRLYRLRLVSFHDVFACVFLFALPASAVANLLIDGGFESGPVSVGLPGAIGAWGGDPAGVTGAENGISPAEGVAMLRFDATQLNGAGAGTGSDLWQLVDASGLRGRVLNLSAQVNRVAGDASTDTRFRIDIRAFSGSPVQFDDGVTTAPPAILIETATILSDSDPTTWETIHVTMSVPGAADYLGVLVSAIENVENDLSPPELDGHYVDDVQLVVAPVPAPTISPIAFILLTILLMFVFRSFLIQSRFFRENG